MRRTVETSRCCVLVDSAGSMAPGAVIRAIRRNYPVARAAITSGLTRVGPARNRIPGILLRSVDDRLHIADTIYPVSKRADAVGPKREDFTFPRRGLHLVILCKDFGPSFPRTELVFRRHHRQPHFETISLGFREGYRSRDRNACVRLVPTNFNETGGETGVGGEGEYWPSPDRPLVPSISFFLFSETRLKHPFLAGTFITLTPCAQVAR